jgi:predicted NAD/FAD-dependent oxidoreductase
MPGPQAARLLRRTAPGLADEADQPYDATIAVVARFAERTWAEFEGALVRDLPIAWLADDGRSRGDGAPVLVAHTTAELAARSLKDPGAVVASALGAMRQVLGVDLDPVEAFAHRWTFAQPLAPRDRRFLLTDTGLGLCGDGWGAPGGIEGAWLSGDGLGAAVVDHLTGSARGR